MFSARRWPWKDLRRLLPGCRTRGGYTIDPASGRAQLASIGDAFSNPVVLRGYTNALMVAVILQLPIGGWPGINETDYQPMKIAAAEANWDTCQPCSISVIQVGGYNEDETPTKIIEDVICCPSWPPAPGHRYLGRRGARHARGQRPPQPAVRLGYYAPNVVIQCWSMRAMAYPAVVGLFLGLWGALLLWQKSGATHSIHHGHSGSPTWWLTTSIPIRPFLKSSEAMTLLSGTPFAGYVVCRRYWGYSPDHPDRVNPRRLRLESIEVPLVVFTWRIPGRVIAAVVLVALQIAIAVDRVNRRGLRAGEPQGVRRDGTSFFLLRCLLSAAAAYYLWAGFWLPAFWLLPLPVGPQTTSARQRKRHQRGTALVIATVAGPQSG